MNIDLFDLNIPELNKTKKLLRKNFHADMKSDLHIMRIIFPPEYTYGRHFHKSRDELYILTSGCLEIKKYHKGKVDICTLKENSNNSYLCVAEEHHSVCNPSSVDPAVVFEIRRGPFDPKDTVKLF